MWVSRKLFSILCSSLLLCVLATANATTINFDTDAAGNPLVAPPLFMDTTHLAELYAPLGVHFSGPAPLDGGAILDQLGNFGIDARSGRNFLAFNEGAPLQDGGIPRSPETIAFDTPVGWASIYVSGGGAVRTISLQAYDASNLLVDSDILNSISGQWSPLSVSSQGGIAWLKLTDGVIFVADDLEFSGAVVPLPSALWGGLALLGALGIKRIRRRAA